MSLTFLTMSLDARQTRCRTAVSGFRRSKPLADPPGIGLHHPTPPAFTGSPLDVVSPSDYRVRAQGWAQLCVSVKVVRGNAERRQVISLALQAFFTGSLGFAWGVRIGTLI
jgi:hypothetical protein